MNSTFTDIQPLVGNIVKVNRSGPEFAIGTLVLAKSDYLALLTDHTTTYYQLHHVKSVTISSKGIPQQVDKEKLLDVETFSVLLSNLQGKPVSINRGGPDKNTGTLLDTSEDFITLNTKTNGIVYILINNIKSISIDNSSTAGVEIGPNAGGSTTQIQANEFVSLLSLLKFKWVEISSGDHDQVEGVLIESDDQQVIVVSNEEVLRVKTFHIKRLNQVNEVDVFKPKFVEPVMEVEPIQEQEATTQVKPTNDETKKKNKKKKKKKKKKK